MKYINLILLLSLFFVCCDDKKEIREGYFDKLIKEKEAIVISCTRCGCVMSFIQAYTNGFKIPIYADSNCVDNNFSLKYTQLNSKLLDSLFKNNYNIILFKKLPSGILHRILKTEENTRFEAICDDFFKK